MNEASPSTDLHLELELSPWVSLAGWQNAVPVVRRIVVENRGAVASEELLVRITVDPPVADVWERSVTSIPSGGTCSLDVVDLRFSPRELAHQIESARGRLEVELRSGDSVVTKVSRELELIAPTHWPGARWLPELLAAWVMPNHPALVPVLRAAAERLGQGRGLSGYQQREAVRPIVRSLYETFQGFGPRYINPPASFEREGQKIRTPDQVLGGGLGTCVDFTVLFAGLLEEAGLHPLIVVLADHAFPGVWLVDSQFHQPLIDDPALLRKRIRLGELCVFDSSAVATGLSFDRAREEASAMLEDSTGFRFAVDVAAARQRRIRPLPLRLEEAQGEAPLARAFEPPTPGSALLDPSWDEAPPEEAAAPEASPVPERLKRWRAKLLDLTLNNRLLNFRETKGTVRLLVDDLAAFEDAMAGEAAFALLPRPDPLAGRDVELHKAMAGEDPIRLYLAEQRQSGILHAPLVGEELEKRLLELYRKSRTELEETGAVSLYVAIGFLRWFESDESEIERKAPLLLVPATLERGSGQAPYRIAIAEDETRVNVTLLKKLETDFGLDTAGMETPPTDDAGVDVRRVLKDFARLVQDFPRWDVLDEVQLGQFSFSKFLMWLDLAANAGKLLENELVHRLFQGKSELLPWAKMPIEESALDSRPVGELATINDADPSQLQAIHAANDGNSFVLQGPPGTGKSQTITNLIAQTLSRGKSVLFVSQKMAALEVVQRRLEEAGLGPFCLELHSDKTNKKAVVDQLRAALDAAGLGAPVQIEEKLRTLQTAQDELDGFAELLRTPGPFGLNPYEVCSRLIGMRQVPEVRLALGSPETVDRARHSALRELAGKLARDAAEARPCPDHPWARARCRSWSPELARNVESGLMELAQALAGVRERGAELASVLGMDEPPSEARRVEASAELADLLLRSPTPPLVMVRGGNFNEMEASIRKWLGHVRARSASWSPLADTFEPRLLSLDLEPLRIRFHRWAGAFFLFAWLMLWGSRRLLRGVARKALPPARELAAGLDQALLVRAEDDALANAATEARTLLGRVWRGADTDPDEVDRLLEWTRRFRQASAQFFGMEALASAERTARLATDQHEAIAPGTDGARALESYAKAGQRLRAAQERLQSLLELAPAADPSLEARQGEVRRWQSALGGLRDWCALQSTLAEFRAHGLGPVADAVERGEVSAKEVGATLERAIYQWWWEGLLAREPRLGRFRGIDHEAVIDRFRGLDQDSIALFRKRLQTELAVRLPDAQAPGEEMALLRRQLQLKQRHMPVRKLFSRIPGVLRRLKPCVLMSPQSVARYLAHDLEPFDLVLFDEASQIPPWDAVGAIARGRQTVVVGDSKQLPPTRFFDRAIEEDDAPDEEDLVEMESILDEASAALPNLSLKWHYRSRHESLIAFSNHCYYEGCLHTFPSAEANVPELGVKLRHVEGGFYDRGGSRQNQAEAEAVVAELFRILEVGGKSLGVVTFSLTQQRLIEDLVEVELRRRPGMERHFNADCREPVFIKNLENVQGDERDVMLFSICYGPDRAGRVSMNFGPLNRQGGERRLNVAVTRARERTVVFTSLRPDQIDLGRSRQVGVAQLKSYLDYARRGMLALDASAVPTGQAPDSPFEEEVLRILRSEGWEVHPQVGCSGYRVDLAVVDPERPGAYLLGIECDGATYHSSACARERDRLRQQVLEQLGWRFHRIWSTDWWLDRDRALARLRGALETARREPRVERSVAVPTPHEEPAPVVPQAPVPVAKGQFADAATPPGAQPYPRLEAKRLGDSESFYSEPNAVARRLQEVVASCGPIHSEAAGRLVIASWGLHQLGRRIREQLQEAIRQLPNASQPVARGEWLWPAELDPTSWRGIRVPGGTGDGRRPAEQIPPEEIANAAEWVLERAVGPVDRDELLRETGRIFGIDRIGHHVREALTSGLDLLVASGRASAEDSCLRRTLLD